MSEVYFLRALRPQYHQSESLVTKLPELLEKGWKDKFLKVHGRDPYIQVYAAEKAGLGTTKYDFIEV